MANPPPPKMPAPSPKQTAPWRLKVGKAVPWLLAVFTIGAVIQVFLAGYGIENLGAAGMESHIVFAHVIEAIPLLVLIAGFVGADWRMGVGGIVLLVLFQAQYFLLGAPQPYNGLHAANGVALIIIATVLFLRRLPWGSRLASAAPARTAAATPTPRTTVPPVRTASTPRMPPPPQR